MLNQQQDNVKYSQDLLKHIGKLLSKAQAKQPSAKLDKYFRYYKGEFAGEDKVINQRNVIMPIVEAKSTFINDAQISTAVVPMLHSQQDLQNYNTAEEIAEILNDCVKTVLKNNSEGALRQKEVRAGSIFGLAISETVWDSEFNMSGDIKVNFVLPKNFFPDPTATCIEDCNFIFVKEYFSAITLKAKYPQFAEKIKTLSANKSGNGITNWANKAKTGIQPVTALGNASLQFTYADSSHITDNSEMFTVWKCYFKDDSTFIADAVDKDSSDSDKAQEIGQKYPNGRIVLFVDGAKDFILEDKEIDYPFGFPFDIYNPINSDDIWGIGDVEGLINIQDRINRTYTKAQNAVAKSEKWILNFKGSGIKKQSFISGVNIIDQVTPSMKPEVLDNGQLDYLQGLSQWAERLEDSANKISRLNDQMISGEHVPGVDSGVQIKALNESPMTTIRSMQRNYKDFCVSRTKKIIALIQKYYNTQRILRIADGQKFIEIGTRQNDDDGNEIPGSGTLTIHQKTVQETQDPDQQNNLEMQIIKTIKGDFSLGFYDVEVIAGTEVPRSPQERSQLTQWAWQNKLLPSGTKGIKLLFEALDFPNRHQIIQALEDQEQAESQQAKEPPTDKITVSFKDLPPSAQIEWLQNNGFPQAAQAIKDVHSQPPPQPELPPEGITNAV